jgi:hypothetical protein
MGRTCKPCDANGRYDAVSSDWRGTTDGHLVLMGRYAAPGGSRIFSLLTPKLIGGMTALLREVRYTEMAVRACVEGWVTVRFTVSENGEVVDPKVLVGIGAGCDEECVRLEKCSSGRGGSEGRRYACGCLCRSCSGFDERLKERSQPTSRRPAPAPGSSWQARVEDELPRRTDIEFGELFVPRIDQIIMLLLQHVLRQ